MLDLRLWRRLWTLFLLLLSVASGLVFGPLASTVHAQEPDAELTWRSVITEHFEIHYHEPLGLVARRAGAVAEQVHEKFLKMYRIHSHEKTHIVLSDETDTANGSASVIPYNAIVLYVTAPEDLSPLGDYDDWLTELITHEYTHIYHLNQISGLPTLVNQIFGKIYAPNQIQPRWFIEGLAVHEESRYSAGGRIRSTMFDMFLRMDSLEKRFLRIDQISNIADRWPHGTMWYLYGGFFAHYISETYGNDALAEIAYGYGRQLIPYGLNRIAKRATGRSFIELYQDFEAHVHSRARTTLSRVRSEGLREGRRMTFQGEEVRTPRFMNNNEVVYFAQDNRMRPQLRVLTIKDASVRALRRVIGYGAPAPPRGRPEFIYSAEDTFRHIYFFNDLFTYNLTNGDTERLTKGLRANEPDVSMDGNKVAFTLNSAGTTHLVTADRNDFENSKKMVLRSERFGQVYTPKWSPDGRTIAVSTWNEGGKRDIELVDARTGKRTKVTDDRAMDTGPAWSYDGKTLYFSSDRTGVANIYAWDVATHELKQVTNVVAGAYQPDVSPDGKTLIYVGYTSRGFDLFAMTLNPQLYETAEPYEDDRPPASEAKRLTLAMGELYNPFHTFYPRNYMLDFRADGFGQQIGVNVYAFDVLNRHQLDARIAYGLERGDVTFDSTYTLSVTPLPLRVRAFRFMAPRTGYSVTDESRSWAEETWGGSAGVSFRFPHAYDSHSLAASYSVAYSRPYDIESVQVDPNGQPPVIPRNRWLSGVSLGWAFSNVEKYIYDISPSRGRAFNFGVGFTEPLGIGNVHATTLNWGASQYVTNPWIRGQVLALHYAGGLSLGDASRRAAFSVGGFSQTSIVDSLLNGVVLGGVALRGYRPFDRSGAHYELLQGEYRFLIYRTNMGIYTLPVYVNRIFANVFADWGDAFRGKIDFSNFRLGVGTELFVDFTLGYFISYTLRLGVAQGVNEGGQTQVYANIGTPF